MTQPLLRVFDGEHGTLLAEVVAAGGQLVVHAFGKRGDRWVSTSILPITDPDQTLRLAPVHGRRFDPIPVSMLIERITMGHRKLRLFSEGSFEHVVGRRHNATLRQKFLHSMAADRAALEFYQARGNTGLVRFFQGRIDATRAHHDRLRRDTHKGLGNPADGTALDYSVT